MRVPGRFRLGSATHTGLVRSGNEDDYLAIAPPSGTPFDLVVAIADGMGGVAGGAEASRTGLRGFAAGVLQLGDAAATGELTALVARGFSGAWARVREQAQAVPALREMGTTLTALAFRGDRLVLGHVGDSRAYRLRDGTLQQLSIDHASREQGNRLMRCIGGGLAEAAPDLVELDLAVGDRFLLCSDGIWGTVEPARLLEVLQRAPAATAAERLVVAALAFGGPDNATAVVVHAVDAAAAAGAVDIVLPREEASRIGDLARGRVRLGAPLWPWLLLAAAVTLLAAVAIHATTGFDAFVWLRTLF